MDLTVTFMLEDRLYELLEDKLPNLGKRVRRAVKKEVGSQVEDLFDIRIEATPTVKKEEEIVPEKHKPAEEVQQPEHQQEHAPEAPKTPSVEDCRAAIIETRKRVMGDDYENNKDGEAYKKYNSAITAMCRQIIHQLSGGATKKLPELPEDKRADFIKECESIGLSNTGELVSEHAPF